MGTISATGQLKHHFWGDYYASIALCFTSDDNASAAQPLLGDKWKKAEKVKSVLLWHGNSEELDICKQTLVKYGADGSKIDSVAKSVDYGEPFTIEMKDIVPPEQEKLFK